MNLVARCLCRKVFVHFEQGQRRLDEVVQLEAQSPRLIALKEPHIFIRFPIAGALKNSLDTLLRIGVFLD